MSGDSATELVDKLMIEAISADPTLADDPVRLAERVNALMATRREALKLINAPDDDGHPDDVLGPRWRQGSHPFENIQRRN